MKKGGKVAMLICAAMLMGALSGCGAAEKTPAITLDPGGASDISTAKPQATVSTADGEKVTLDVMMLKYEMNILIPYSEIITTFAAKNNIGINMIECEGSQDQYEKLMPLIAADEMPDVVLMGGINQTDIYKLAYEGKLLDMAPYMDSSEKFNREDYYEAILDGGYFYGGQYIMPIGYNVPLLITSQEKIDRYGLSFDGMTGREIIEYLYALTDEHIDEDVITVMPFDLGYRFTVNELFQFLGLKLIDYDNMDMVYDINDIYLAAEFTKKIANDFADNSTDDEVSGTMLQVMEFMAGKTIVQLTTMGSHTNGLGWYDSTYAEIGETMRFFPLPSADATDEYCAVIKAYGVVSADTKAPEACVEFLRQMMDTVYTATKIVSVDTLNREAVNYRARMTSRLSNGTLVSDIIKEQYAEVLENVTSATIMDYSTVNGAASDSFLQFTFSEKTLREVIDIFEEDVLEYQSEMLMVGR